MVIDFHVHLTTVEGMARLFRDDGQDPLSKSYLAKYMDLARERQGRTSRAAWLEAMERCGVDRVVLNATDALNQEVLDLVEAEPGRFSGLFYADPALPESLAELDRFVGPGKLAGLGELSPTWEKYRLDDRRLFPLYDRVQELGVPLLWHFGIGFFPFADLNYSQPADLMNVVRYFPKIPHVISHLGMEQGEQFLAQVSWLKEWFKAPIYFDLANIHGLAKYFLRLRHFSLREHLARFLEVLGPEGIIWGTDSGAPYESCPFEAETYKILDGLKLGAPAMDLIMGGNAARLLGL